MKSSTGTDRKIYVILAILASLLTLKKFIPYLLVICTYSSHMNKYFSKKSFHQAEVRIFSVRRCTDAAKKSKDQILHNVYTETHWTNSFFSTLMRSH